MLSADEYARLLKLASTPTIALVESGKPDTCLISYSSKWVIDFGATDHMTSNSSLFTTFQSHPSTFIVTLADESKSCVLRLDTINLIPLGFQKGIDVIVLLFDDTLCLLMLHFFRLPRFPFLQPLLVRGRMMIY